MFSAEDSMAVCYCVDNLVISVEKANTVKKAIFKRLESTL